ncbi:MAG: hypothetical protein BWY57_01655 [Betaproteobacteria bacterium ADurb.Bin341]|nr:MAG: hypothetical protein BWY57_01655 [Betaproteobacteria bacterium ADurb.Bin341]
MTTTWTAVEERIAWTATEDPSYQFVTLRPTTVTLESGGDGGGAVDSVNGATGVVVLDAASVGADPAGTAAEGYRVAFTCPVFLKAQMEAEKECKLIENLSVIPLVFMPKRGTCGGSIKDPK